MDVGSHFSTPGKMPELPTSPNTAGTESVKLPTVPPLPSIASRRAAMTEVIETPPKIQLPAINVREPSDPPPLNLEARTKLKCETLRTLNSLSNEAKAMKKGSISSKAVDVAIANLQTQKINTEILKNQATVLLHDVANGVQVKPEILSTVAESLQKIQIHDPTNTTLMLQLFEASALKYAEQGDNTNAFKVRGRAAETIEFNSKHFLSDMTKAVASGIARQVLPDVGLHIPSGASTAPDGVALRTRPHTDGTTRDVAEFLLAPAPRAELTKKLSLLCDVKSIGGKPTVVTNDVNFALFEASIPSNLRPVTIALSGAQYQGKDEKGNFSTDPKHAVNFNTKIYEIGFGDGSKVTFGLDPAFKLVHNGIHVEVPSNLPQGQGIKQMQQMLTVLGIGPVFGGQRTEDDERLLYSLMVRSHFPQSFDKLEKDPNFYNMSPIALRAKIMEIEPGMKKVFKEYEKNPSLIGVQEIFPGKNMYTLADIPQNMKKAGVYGFMAGVGCSRKDNSGAEYKNFDAVMSILNFGPLSTAERLHSATNLRGGASIEQDVKTSDKGNFLRATNKTVSKLEINDRNIKFSGDVQILYDVSVIGVGASACYFGDQFGLTNENWGKNNQSAVYKNRLSPEDFAKGLGEKTDKFALNATVPDDHMVNDNGVVVDMKSKKPVKDPLGGGFNEVCIDGGNINPSFIKGLVVQSEEVKQGLLVAMENKGMLKYAERNAAGQIVKGAIFYRPDINGQNALMTSVTDFIHVNNKFEEKMWGKPRK
jgi:hypothetical protein